MVKRLSEHDWFKQPSEVSVESILKYLVGKLITRDPSNHEDVAKYIVEMNE